METIQAKAHYSDEEMEERFAATLLTDNDYDLVVRDNCIVLKPDGSPLLIYLKGVIPLAHCRNAWQNLYEAATAFLGANRGMASGKGKIEAPVEFGDVTGSRIRFYKEDGSLSNTNHALMSDELGNLIRKHGGRLLMQQSDGTFVERQSKTVPSGIVGYMDKNPRFPYCRLTAYNLNYPEKFAGALPLIRSVDRAFANALPERYAAQKAVVEATTPDFYISGTVFTTITVNLNWQTAVHKDVGDLKEGFGVMAALRAGKFDGCFTCFPKYRVAADMQTGDVLLGDVHEWHGNTPVHPITAYERLSLIFYYRERMRECGSATEELEHAKLHRGITHLKEWKHEPDTAN